MAEPKLSALELRIMSEFWSRGACSIREIHEAVAKRDKPAYTTVQTMMNVLESKGYLRKEPGERAQVYVPARPQQAVVRSMVKEFVDRVFDGSARPLLLHLVKEKGLTDRERRALLRLLDAGNCWVKLSGPYRITPRPAVPFDDVTPIARAVVARRPDRLVWGTDWPHPSIPTAMPNDGDLVDMLADWVPDAGTRRTASSRTPDRRREGRARGDALR